MRNLNEILKNNHFSISLEFLEKISNLEIKEKKMIKRKFDWCINPVRCLRIKYNKNISNREIREIFESNEEVVAAFKILDTESFEVFYLLEKIKDNNKKWQAV